MADKNVDLTALKQLQTYFTPKVKRAIQQELEAEADLEESPEPLPTINWGRYIQYPPPVSLAQSISGVWTNISGTNPVQTDIEAQDVDFSE